MPSRETGTRAESTPQKQLLVLGKISSILEVFSLSRPELTLADIRDATDMPTSTVQRLVSNLVAQGFLDRHDDVYRIGMHLAYLAAPATAGRSHLDVITPLLSEIRDETGETTCLFHREGRQRVCVGLAETRHSLRREMHVGKIVPLHVGSASRVLLAWDSDALDEVLSADLETITESTITSHARLEEAVRRTRDTGFAITVGERDTGGAGLSVPVFDARARVVAALSITGPAVRITDDVLRGWADYLLEYAERMTRMLGGRFPGEQPASVSV